MFGYVRPCKPEMKLREYETYQAVYCGLCKQLGHSYGLFSRFTLNYDFTFLALLSIALGDEKPLYCRERCIAHPLKKRSCCHLQCSSGTGYELAAGAAVLMLYYKAKDNLTDSPLHKKIICLLTMPFFSAIRKKALPKYQNVDGILSTMMEQQQKLEAAGCRDADQAAEPTANALSALLAMLSEDAVQQRILAQMGYQLGRWIYFMDALDDIHEDVKNKSYNPFVQRSLFSAEDAAEIIPQNDIPAKTIADAIGTLNLTAAQLAAAYDLLDFQRFRPVLDNIIHLGLRESMMVVLQRHHYESIADRLFDGQDFSENGNAEERAWLKHDRSL